MGYVRGGHVEAKKREYRAYLKAEWSRFPSLRKLLADKFPAQLANIERCGQQFRVKRNVADPRVYALRPAGCNEVPFCFECSRRATVRRVANALDHFQRATPAGKPVIFLRAVQTAPIYEDGTGWGRAACRDLTGFNRIVWDTCRETFGEGVGGVFSYQDFGERGFQKRHPHLEFTLNGWKLQDGHAVRVEPPELRGGGRALWDSRIVGGARRLDLLAERGNVRFERPIFGVKPFYRKLRYQMRELVDVRKVEYSREAKTVSWLSYKDARRYALPVSDFMAGLAEYSWRLGAWRKQGSYGGKQELHRKHGILSKRSIRKTQAAMGGLPPKHGARCPCDECGDWEWVAGDDADNHTDG